MNTESTSSHPDMTPDHLAKACADKLWGPDTCSQWLGMELLEVRPGYARIRMKVRPEFLNGHGICHGGLMFTLADSTFAFACNSHNVPTVAAGCSIEFLKPVQGADTLTAEGQEQTLSGRHGIYDIRVTNSAGEAVAMFRGKSAQLKGAIL